MAVAVRSEHVAGRTAAIELEGDEIGGGVWRGWIEGKREGRGGFCGVAVAIPEVHHLWNKLNSIRC